MGSVCLAQLGERSLPIPEVCGSNPVIGKIYWTFVYCQLCIEKTKINKKRGREWPIFLRKIQNMGSSFKSFHSRGGMSCLAKHVFLNGPSPASFSFIFGLFNKQYITIFTANQCEKSQSSIQRRDSNPRPLEHESSPITTRQGRLSGKICLLCLRKGKDMW